MTVYFGFYNSSSGDRTYDAIDFSKLFDGLINDGIFASQGDKFIVVEDSPVSMDVVVGSGRAWFNHTWTLNDADLDVTVPTAHATLNRIDIVYLEVDESTRTNSIDIVSGTPATTPVAPTLTQTSTVHQYALAHIYVGAAAVGISQEDITNKVGLSATPFVTGIIDQVDIDELLLEWQAEWNTWFDDIKDQLSTEAETNLQAQIWDLAGVSSGAPPYSDDMVSLSGHDHSGSHPQIDSAGLATGSVTNSKLATNAISQIKMQDNSVGTNEIINDAVTNAKLAANSVDTEQIINECITPAKLTNRYRRQVLGVGYSNAASYFVSAPYMKVPEISGSVANEFIYHVFATPKDWQDELGSMSLYVKWHAPAGGVKVRWRLRYWPFGEYYGSTYIQVDVTTQNPPFQYNDVVTDLLCSTIGGSDVYYSDVYSGLCIGLSRDYAHADDTLAPTAVPIIGLSLSYPSDS